jgi:glycosyltransferase involved in cell wall biosynthesis
VKKVKILIVGTDPSGTLLYYPTKLAVEFCKRGHTVVLLKRNGSEEQSPGLSKELTSNGVVIKQSLALRYSGALGLLLAATTTADIAAFRPDVIQTWGPITTCQLGLFWPWARRIAMINSMKSTQAISWKHKLGGILLNTCADRVFALCAREKERLLEAGVARERLGVLHHPVDCDGLLKAVATRKKADVIAKYALPTNKKLIGCFANLYPYKRQDLLIRAIYDLREEASAWHLVLAGKGPSLRAYRELTSSLGMESRVSFLGRLPQTEAARLLSCMDAAAHCSSAETFGVSIVEPPLFGIPMLTTRVGIAFEFERSNQAVVVEPNSLEAIKRGLRRILDPDDDVRMMSATSPEFVRSNFSVSTTADRLMNIYLDAK